MYLTGVLAKGGGRGSFKGRRKVYEEMRSEMRTVSFLLGCEGKNSPKESGK
jgi:hypothetical protein